MSDASRPNRFLENFHQQVSALSSVERPASDDEVVKAYHEAVTLGITLESAFLRRINPVSSRLVSEVAINSLLTVNAKPDHAERQRLVALFENPHLPERELQRILRHTRVTTDTLEKTWSAEPQRTNHLLGLRQDLLSSVITENRLPASDPLMDGVLQSLATWPVPREVTAFWKSDTACWHLFEMMRHWKGHTIETLTTLMRAPKIFWQDAGMAITILARPDASPALIGQSISARPDRLLSPQETEAILQGFLAGKYPDRWTKGATEELIAHVDAASQTTILTHILPLTPRETWPSPVWCAQHILVDVDPSPANEHVLIPWIEQEVDFRIWSHIGQLPWGAILANPDSSRNVRVKIAALLGRIGPAATPSAITTPPTPSAVTPATTPRTSADVIAPVAPEAVAVSPGDDSGSRIQSLCSSAGVGHSANISSPAVVCSPAPLGSLVPLGSAAPNTQRPLSTAESHLSSGLGPKKKPLRRSSR